MGAPDRSNVVDFHLQAVREAVEEAPEAPADERKGGGGGSGGSTPETVPVEFSDDALAKEFSDRHAGDWLHVAAWNRWLEWDGMRWAVEETKKVWAHARGIAHDAGVRCRQERNERMAAQVASARTVYAIEKLASADRRHARPADAFDADAWALNTPSGIVDLRTGVPRPHSKPEMHTKITLAGCGAEAPLWEEFLDQVTAGDGELKGYLQRAAGYCLTGSIEEHALFFVYGPGGNGKSVFLNTLVEVLGDYATTAPMDTFTVSRGERHPTELAMLRGARLVIAQETEEGRRFDEAKIKAVTGGDPVTARHMRQDFFTFRPTFKLLLAGNYRPAMRSVDDAMRRRLHIIPFTARIARPDKKLPEKLRGEYDGILRWMVEGAIWWQREGLRPPQIVLDATSDYFETEDAIGRWVFERCSLDPNATALTQELFSDWKVWAHEAGEFVGSMRRFAQLLERRPDVERWQHSMTRQRGFRGIGLLARPSELNLGDGNGARAPERRSDGGAAPGDDFTFEE